jgi:hypothetical protein
MQKSKLAKFPHDMGKCSEIKSQLNALYEAERKRLEDEGAKKWCGGVLCVYGDEDVQEECACLCTRDGGRRSRNLILGEGIEK